MNKLALLSTVASLALVTAAFADGNGCCPSQSTNTASGGSCTGMQGSALLNAYVKQASEGNESADVYATPLYPGKSHIRTTTATDDGNPAAEQSAYSSLKYKYKGVTYYFHDKGCIARFKTHPAKYIAAQSLASSPLAPAVIDSRILNQADAAPALAKK